MILTRALSNLYVTQTFIMTIMLTLMIAAFPCKSPSVGSCFATCESIMNTTWSQSSIVFYTAILIIEFCCTNYFVHVNFIAGGLMEVCMVFIFNYFIKGITRLINYSLQSILHCFNNNRFKVMWCTPMPQ